MPRYCGRQPMGLLRTWPVDRRVGSPRNNGPELLEAIAHRLPEAAVS